MAARVLLTMPDPFDPRRRAKATILTAALALASCSFLPPSLRGDAAPPPANATKDAAAPGPAAAARPAPDTTTSAAPAETRMYKGTGNFINQKPPLPVPPSP